MPMRSASSAISGRRATRASRCPTILDSKLPILVPLVRALPGHYRFTPAKDLASEIEWAKSRRLTPQTYEAALTAVRSRTAPPREAPIPVDLFVRTFAGYERARTRAGRIDFDDLLVETVDLLETRRRGRRDRPRAQALVQRRRVPGHEPAPAAAARAVGGRPPGRVRRRRRGPDDLHVHRREQRVPDRVRRPPSGRPGRDAQRQLPLEPAGARAGQPAARLDRPDQAPRDDAAVRPGADDRPPQHRGRRARRARRLGPGAASRPGRPRRRSRCSSG